MGRNHHQCQNISTSGHMVAAAGPSLALMLLTPPPSEHILHRGLITAAAAAVSSNPSLSQLVAVQPTI
jgi:hypothetical protein